MQVTLDKRAHVGSDAELASALIVGIVAIVAAFALNPRTGNAFSSSSGCLHLSHVECLDRQVT
eukprot:2135094-Amphidinium_carterae.1